VLEHEYDLVVTEGATDDEGTNGLVILSCKHHSPLWGTAGTEEHREIMRECRGAIFEQTTGRAVCVPFRKFFNVGETHAEQLAWEGAVAEEKVDGCLLKLFHWRGAWRLASNRQLDVSRTTGKYACTGRSNRQLFEEAAEASLLDYARLVVGRCYLLERVHPDFKIVVAYDTPALWHIGTRDLITLREIDDDDVGLPRPRRWPVASVQECRRLLDSTAGLPEGLVVREAVAASGGGAGGRVRGAGQVRRLKLKRPEYVWMHHCAHGGGPHGAAARFDASWVARCARIDGMAAARACLNAWLRDEESELAAYYPDVHARAYAAVAAALAALMARGAVPSLREGGARDPRERSPGGRFVHEEALWEAVQRERER